jgi:hypothetical protein
MAEFVSNQLPDGTASLELPPESWADGSRADFGSLPGDCIESLVGGFLEPTKRKLFLGCMRTLRDRPSNQVRQPIRNPAYLDVPEFPMVVGRSEIRRELPHLVERINAQH